MEGETYMHRESEAGKQRLVQPEREEEEEEGYIEQFQDVPVYIVANSGVSSKSRC
jgi:hypothetical protein